MHDHYISSLKAFGSVELCSFCEGYFLQQMSALLERESFRSLLLGPHGARQGNNTSLLAHSRGESPLEELEATLAQRLRSLYVSSRVWGQPNGCRGEKRNKQKNMTVGAHVSSPIQYWIFRGYLNGTSTGSLLGTSEKAVFHIFKNSILSFIAVSSILMRKKIGWGAFLQGAGSLDGCNKWQLWIMKHHCPLMDKTGKVSSCLEGFGWVLPRPLPCQQKTEALYSDNWLKYLLKTGVRQPCWTFGFVPFQLIMQSGCVAVDSSAPAFT